MTSLRRAKLDDHWRTSYKRRYSCSLAEVSLNDGRIFGDVSLELYSGINAIVGKNGVGKSNLIRSIFNLLASESSNRRKFPKLVDDCRISANVTLNGESVRVSSDVAAEDDELGYRVLCLIFDPCNLIPEVQKLFVDQDNIEELLEDFGFVELGADELKITNFLLNSNYSNIKMFSIEDEFESFPMLPFFVVEKDGASYDSRSMGLGELSLLYFFWLTKMIEKETRPCVVLIEEPESFLPPLVQERLCDIIAKSASEYGVFFVISTHSEHVLRRIPRTHMHVMARVESKIQFISDAKKIEQMQALGLGSPKISGLLFEDIAAREFCKALIKCSSIFVVDSFHYHISGSDGDIIQDLARFPDGVDRFPLVGVFDGDAKGKFDKQLKNTNHYAFLPLNLSPEEVVLSFIEDKGDTLIAEVLNVPTRRLSAAKDAVAGADHHDYFYDLAYSLSRSFDSVFPLLCEAWTNDPVNEELVETFLDELSNGLK